MIYHSASHGHQLEYAKVALLKAQQSYAIAPYMCNDTYI